MLAAVAAWAERREMLELAHVFGKCGVLGMRSGGSCSSGCSVTDRLLLTH